MQSNGAKKALLIIFMLLLIAGTGYLFYTFHQNEKQEQKEVSVEANDTNQNYDRIYEIDEELSELRNGETKATEHVGTVFILFDSPDKKIDEGAYATFSKAGYKPIITVTDDAFPGETGMLSRDRIRELCSEGCSLAVSAPNDKDLEKLLNRIYWAGLPHPTVLFNSSGTNSTMEAAAAEEEIHTAVCLDYLTDIENTGDTLLMSGVELNSDDRETYRKNATESQNTCVYVMGFSTTKRLYSSATAKEVIDTLQDYVDREVIKIMSPTEAYNYYHKISQKILTSEEAKNRKIEKLEKEKKKLFDEMNETDESDGSGDAKDSGESKESD